MQASARQLTTSFRQTFSFAFRFFTASTGKESRYFLPVMAPLYVMLGIELARFFDPHRRPNATREKLGFWGVVVGVPPRGLGEPREGRVVD